MLNKRHVLKMGLLQNNHRFLRTFVCSAYSQSVAPSGSVRGYTMGRVATSARLLARAMGFVLALGLGVTQVGAEEIMQTTEVQSQSEAQVKSPVLSEVVVSGQSVGKGLFRYFLWRVYEAELIAPNGQWAYPTGYEKPFALKLTYLRDLSGVAIAERTLDEMRTQGFKDEVLMQQWFDQIKNIFPDVSDGVSLIGVHVPGLGAHFFRGDTYIDTVEDPRFSRQFFDIWLSDKTTGPELRTQLLGL